MNDNKTARLARFGLLIALEMILSYIESLIPVFAAVPGVKAGLPNIVIVFTLYRMGARDAVIVSLVRVVLVAFTFGNLFAMIYALAGTLLSLAVMILLKKSGRFGITGVSVAGGVAHNIGQIIVAVFVTETAKLLYYLPVLCISGTAAGVVIGLLAAAMVKRIRKF